MSLLQYNLIGLKFGLQNILLKSKSVGSELAKSGEASGAEQTFLQSLGNIIGTVEAIAIGLVAIAIIATGVLMVVGGEEGRQKAKKSFPWVILGAILILGAVTIAKYFTDQVEFKS